MGKKSAPRTPPPPDPVVVSNAQADANIRAAQEQQRLNMVNTYGPEGSVVYRADPNAPGGYSQTTSLSPEEQAIYNAQKATELGATNIAHDQLGRVQTALQTPLNTQGLPSLQGGVNVNYGYGGGYPSGQGKAARMQPPAPGSSYAVDDFQGAPRQGGGSIFGGLHNKSDVLAENGWAPTRTEPSIFGGRTGVIAQQGFGGYQPQMPGGVGPDGLQRSFNPGGSIQRSFDPGAAVQTRMAQPGQIQTDVATRNSFDGGQPLQYSFDPGQAVQGHVGGNQDLARLIATEGAYQQFASRLDPRFDTDEDRLRTRLANQGYSENSTGYQDRLNKFGQQKNDAYNQALLSAIREGETAAQGQFGRELAQGQFANQAAGQMYAQNQGLAGFHNATAGQEYAQNKGQAEFYNAANLAQAMFRNQAQQQGFGQDLSRFQAENAAAAQQFGQNQQQALFGNQAQQQAFGQNLTGAQFWNQSQNQAFNQGLSNAQLSNQARQQGLQEQAYLQNMPINQLTSLLGLGQVGMPQGVQYTPSQVAAPDVLGAYALQTQAQQAAANRAAQQQSGLMGGLFSLGSAAIMASDGRLKTDVRLLRRRPDGSGIYAFRYITDAPGVVRVGVMAQEIKKVRPDLVVKRADGYLAVNYAGLGAA